MKVYLKAGLLVILFVGLACVASAGGKKKGGKSEGMLSGASMRGILTVSTNEHGAAEIHIDAKSGITYNLVLSSLIQNIGDVKAMNGMEVLVKGEIRELDNKKWLTVEGLIARADASNSSKKKK